MARQPALALARPRVVLPANGARRRALVVAACIVATIGLLYLGARETSVFALRTVEVTGGPDSVRTAVLQEVEGMRGESLVALDAGALLRRLDALPFVESVDYDRAFPHTLRLTVVPEQPVAIVQESGRAWIVSERGRVMSEVVSGAAPALPRIRYPLAAPLVPGSFVSDADTRTVVEALAEAPKRTSLPIRSGRLEEGELTLVLDGVGSSQPLVLLGEPTDVWVKLRVAALVLRNLSADERASLAYLDVSLPDRPVASANPQVSD
ncbi:MAG TPA: FtsQ-type POTRA domain-containing protein [Gaiellaceae bacterium]